MRTREELAWAAGLFEGEGYIGNYSQGGYLGRKARVTNTDLEVLQKFQLAIGFGQIYGPRKQTATERKPIWSWEVGRQEHIQALVAMLWFWLGSRRREQAKVVLATLWPPLKPKRQIPLIG
jgi:hypothetical protein